MSPTIPAGALVCTDCTVNGISYPTCYITLSTVNSIAIKSSSHSIVTPPTTTTTTTNPNSTTTITTTTTTTTNASTTPPTIMTPVTTTTTTTTNSSTNPPTTTTTTTTTYPTTTTQGVYNGMYVSGTWYYYSSDNIVIYDSNGDQVYVTSADTLYLKFVPYQSTSTTGGVIPAPPSGSPAEYPAYMYILAQGGTAGPYGENDIESCSVGYNITWIYIGGGGGGSGQVYLQPLNSTSTSNNSVTVSLGPNATSAQNLPGGIDSPILNSWYDVDSTGKIYVAGAIGGQPGDYNTGNGGNGGDSNNNSSGGSNTVITTTTTTGSSPNVGYSGYFGGGGGNGGFSKAQYTLYYNESCTDVSSITQVYGNKTAGTLYGNPGSAGEGKSPGGSSGNPGGFTTPCNFDITTGAQTYPWTNSDSSDQGAWSTPGCTNIVFADGIQTFVGYGGAGGYFYPQEFMDFANPNYKPIAVSAAAGAQSEFMFYYFVPTSP
jgi:hypothetical protein